MPIREVGQSGERKNPRGRRKKRKKARAGRLGSGLKHHLDAIDHGAKLRARIYGVKLPVKSPLRLRRAQDLGASNDGAELRVQILKSYLQELICEFFFKKRAKNKKKLGYICGDTHDTHLYLPTDLANRMFGSSQTKV